jgi:uncharacterized protein (TIGR03067 family)
MRAKMLVLAAMLTAPALADQAPVAGSWTAVRAERDGAVAPDLVGHRLSFAGDRFEIVGPDGRPLYAGTWRADAAADPARIDFVNESGEAAGVTWEGIYRLEGGELTVVDDAPDPQAPRPTRFAAGKGSGYVLVVFTR